MTESVWEDAPDDGSEPAPAAPAARAAPSAVESKAKAVAKPAAAGGDSAKKPASAPSGGVKRYASFPLRRAVSCMPACRFACLPPSRPPCLPMMARAVVCRCVTRKAKAVDPQGPKQASMMNFFGKK